MAIGDKPKKHTDLSLIHFDCNSFLASKNKRSQLMQKKAHVSAHCQIPSATQTHAVHEIKAQLFRKASHHATTKKQNEHNKNQTWNINGETLG